MIESAAREGRSGGRERWSNHHAHSTSRQSSQGTWNKGLLIGQKRPLLPKQVWSIRVRLEMVGSLRDLALFNLAIDSKLRACDLVRLRVDAVCSDGKVRDRAPATSFSRALRVVIEDSESVLAMRFPEASNIRQLYTLARPGTSVDITLLTY